MLRYARVILAASSAAGAMEERVAICALARDEGPFLAEFLDFYRHGGVTKAFLYVDDATVDDTWAVLEPYTARGSVDAFAWPPRPGHGAPVVSACHVIASLPSVVRRAYQTSDM